MLNSVKSIIPQKKLEIKNSILAPMYTSAQESKNTFPELSISLGGGPRSYTMAKWLGKDNRSTTSMIRKLDKWRQNKTGKKLQYPTNNSLHQQKLRKHQPHKCQKPTMSITSKTNPQVPLQVNHHWSYLILHWRIPHLPTKSPSTHSTDNIEDTEFSDESVVQSPVISSKQPIQIAFKQSLETTSVSEDHSTTNTLTRDQRCAVIQACRELHKCNFRDVGKLQNINIDKKDASYQKRFI